ncbi:unnamed protein product [Dicrocoelium dendriticum]|nr:unnamed protein product [Dicrocoelium dendriticum]
MDDWSRLLILYGSQTGQSKSLAERLVMQARSLFDIPFHVSSKETRKASLGINLQPLDSYLPLSRLSKETGIVIFICSTTGYGVPPDNMRIFWRRIMNKNLPVGHALSSNVRFAVLGLGDSSYPKFNIVAKKLYRRLVQLGASPLHIVDPFSEDRTDPGLGLADEEADLGVNTLLQWWIPQLWTIVSKIFRVSFVPGIPVPLSLPFLESPSFISSFWPIFTVKVCENSPNRIVNNMIDSVGSSIEACTLRSGSVLSPQIQTLQIVENVRVTANDHFQDTRLITLCVSCFA